MQSIDLRARSPAENIGHDRRAHEGLGSILRTDLKLGVKVLTRRAAPWRIASDRLLSVIG